MSGAYAGVERHLSKEINSDVCESG